MSAARALRAAGIRGTGSYVPSKVLSNADFEKMVDTSDEWITSRTGIKERRVRGDGETTSDMAVKAAKVALADAGIGVDDLDLIVVATVTGDFLFPSTSCLVQNKLGAQQIGALDVQAACSGFIYALSVAQQFVATGAADNVLVVGAESLSAITDYTDRASAILFGDGAGAAIISSTFDRGEVLSTSLHAEGSGGDVIKIEAGGTSRPTTIESVENREHFMRLRGREVYKFAVQKMVQLVEEARQRHAELELGYVVPHQVNLRIIESAREKLGLEKEQVFVNIDRYGNTSAASIAIGLDEVRRSGTLAKREGDLVVMCAFGAGLTWGSVSCRW